jgi:hypothetical protein
VLPDNFDSTMQYKFVYVFPGFGSNHAALTYGDGQINRYGMNTVGKDKIFIFMNCEFFQGYHHFVNSDNNGPWGKALISEFVPFIDSLYGYSNYTLERYLMGQSSGAWTALWLQLNYPQCFLQAFAASPDPIDFRAHGQNIYTEPNYYFPKKADYADIIKGEKTKLNCILEDVVGEFGQVRTWEATFSPITNDGEVALLFDRETGAITRKVAEAWKNFDMALLVNRNPEKFGEIVSERFHIFVSKDDPYGLSYSVELFENVLKNNGLGCDIKYYEGLGHNVWTDSLREYIHRIIDDNELNI